MPPRLMPALITPFDADGEIDGDAHHFNVGALSSQGVEGFLVAGSTGEGPYLEPGERKRLVAGVRTAAPDAYLLCGVAAESVRSALDQAAEAAEGGADALLVVTPTTLIRGRHAAVTGFYEAVAGAAPLPVFLYSVPKVTGYELPLETAAGLAGLDAVAGIKDSGGDPARIGPLVATGTTVYCGSTPILTEAVEAGGRGGITASSNYAFPMARRVIEDAAAGRPGGGEALAKLSGTVEQHGIGGVKVAAEMIGLRPGWSRPPLQVPGDDAVAAIRKVLEAAGLI